MRRRAIRTALAAAVMTTLALLTAPSSVAQAAGTTAAAPATPVWSLYNAGSVGVGFIYSGWPISGQYEDVLDPGWVALDVYGVYIGSGYCAQRWTSTSSAVDGPWRRAGSDFPPGKYQLSGQYYVKIVPYRGTC
ncbi:hypothetical protein [Catenuloplanes atrovinosus]|uniref:Secreted protein n=1 Tax=Catenuloplanes atrovinosus TaxID=137266 RepID=A0AAE4CBL9_9ACTN|nr:hypothetical protein [Catenuloplanes atrovinosus]MDR7277064.1 hypothetical protein [Catenuloplanes atrovinosus]